MPENYSISRGTHSKNELIRQEYVRCITCEKRVDSKICFACFQAQNHEGHKIHFETCYEITTCDCGDVNYIEAGKGCSIHTEKYPLDSKIVCDDFDLFKNELMQMMLTLIYHLKIDNDHNLKRAYYKQVADIWNYLWICILNFSTQSKEFRDEMVNLLFDKTIFNQNIYGEKLKKFINDKKSEIAAQNKVVLENLENIYARNHKGRESIFLIN